jgi:stress-induced morphogen
MINEPLKKKVYDVLKTGYFNGPDDAVDVSVGPGEENLHLVIVSRKFDGKRLKDRHELIWSELMRHLETNEWGKISLSIGTSPEELKAI